uniref:Uncharacterized protein n=1 Tax=viral metagenome TaxID=1070528 RepID=A0A6H2A265_9ZZZZ
MKCPILTPDYKVTTTQVGYFPKNCLKENCPWWEGTYERCDPGGVSRSLERIRDELAEIARAFHGDVQLRR